MNDMECFLTHSGAMIWRIFELSILQQMPGGDPTWRLPKVLKLVIYGNCSDHFSSNSGDSMRTLIHRNPSARALQS